MKPPAKNEGNSRQRRLGWPFRVASIRHRTREVVCRVSCGWVGGWEGGGRREEREGGG